MSDFGTAAVPFHVSNALSWPVQGQSSAHRHPRSHVVIDGTTFHGELNTCLVYLVFQMRWANAFRSKLRGSGRGELLLLRWQTEAPTLDPSSPWPVGGVPLSRSN